MKRTVNRLFVRFTLLCVAIILGAIAVAQAQRGLNGEAETPGANGEVPATATVSTTGVTAAPIPLVSNDAPANNYLEPPTAYAEQPPYAEPQPDEWTTKNDPPPYEVAADNHAETRIEVVEDQRAYDDPGAYEQPEYQEERTQDIQLVEAEEVAEPYGLDDSIPDIAPPGAGPDDSVYQREMEAVPPLDNGFESTGEALAEPEPVRPAPPYDDSASNAIVPENSLPPESSPADDLRTTGPTLTETPESDVVVRPLEDSTPRPAPADRSDFAAAELSVSEPQPRYAPVNNGVSGSGKPGSAELEGPQTPSLTVAKVAPQEIQVGKLATFKITVRNVGPVSAHDVLIRDEIPHGTELADTSPPAGRSADGAILWQMGTINPGDEVTATMQVMPRAEGDIGSVATVSFQASASVKVRCTKPQLVLEHSSPRQVLVGEDVVFSIKLSNPGTGAATNVVLQEDVPEGLRHVAGPELEYAVGTIRPGETRLLELTLKAAKPGLVENVVAAHADSGLSAEHTHQLQVIAPALQVGIQGPKLRYLQRPANYDFTIANPGTAVAKDVKVVAHLPKGMKFMSTNNSGHYNQQDHTVHWNLSELPANEMGTVKLTAMPMEMGELKIRLQGTAQMQLTDAAEHTTLVEGLAALLFTVIDTDPIEVGGQTTYTIRVVNQGSKVASNLQLAALLPVGMKPISGEGPARGNVNGQRVIFDPLARLAPQSDTTYQIHVEGTQPGDMRIQVQVVSDEIAEPITKEESTHVYSDQ